MNIPFSNTQPKLIVSSAARYFWLSENLYQKVFSSFISSKAYAEMVFQPTID